MLLRAARNILSSFRNDASRFAAQSAIYAAACIHLLLTNETQLVAHMLSHVDLDPLYCATFLSDLQPLLRSGCQKLLEKSCRNALELEEKEAVLVHQHTAQAQIAHYVGMVFEHRAYGYIGCIIGWEVCEVLISLNIVLMTCLSAKVFSDEGMAGKHECTTSRPGSQPTILSRSLP